MADRFFKNYPNSNPTSWSFFHVDTFEVCYLALPENPEKFELYPNCFAINTLIVLQ